MENALRLLWTIWQNCCKCIPFKAQETFRTFREGKGFLPPCMNGFLLSTNVSFITALNHTKGRPLFICIKQNSLCYPPLLFSFVYWWHSLIMYNLPRGENSLSATKWQFTVYVLSYACTLKHPRFIVLKQTMMTSCSLLTPKVTWRFFSPSPPIGQMQGLRGNPLLWALWQNASSSINLQRLGYQEGIAGKIKHCCQ